MSKPLISVVIPCYNGEKVIDKTLRAVFDSTFTDFEVLLIDDGSTDGTKKTLIEKGWFDSLRYKYQENRGISGARNTGIKMARGKYISLLDHDDYPLPNRLESMVAYLESHPEYGMIYTPCIMERLDKRGEQYTQDIYSSHTPRWLPKRFKGDLFENLFYMSVFPSSTLISKEAAVSVGLFDEAFEVCEDYEFFLRLSASYPIGFLEHPSVIHIIHHSNTSKVLGGLYSKYTLMTYNRHYQTLQKKSSRVEDIYRERMASAYWGLAKALLKNGDRKGAKKKAADAIRMNPYRSKYYFRMYKFWL